MYNIYPYKIKCATLEIRLPMKAFSKFTTYIVLKWVLFYIYQFLSGGVRWKFNNVNSQGLFLAAFMLLTLPLVEIVVLYFPFHLALRLRSSLSIPILFLSFALEFLIGWYATNQHFEVWMVAKIFLSIVLFCIMYSKQLRINLFAQ